jgi:mannose-6-phosphate isomerase-like protein (cupin superfamily)
MRRLLLRGAFAAGVFIAHALPMMAQANNTPAATVLTPAQLKAIDDSLPHAALTSAALGRGSGYTYSLTHREATGGIEVHLAWNDVFVIQSGSATLLTGGSLAGAKEASAGELRDGVLTGGTLAKVKPGDVVIIPAGSPHQVQLAAGERVTYLTFKVAVVP